MEYFAVLHRKPTPASRKDFWNSGYQTTLVCPNSLHPSLTDNSILFGLLVFLYRNTSHLHTRNTAKQFSTASGYCFFSYSLWPKFSSTPACTLLGEVPLISDSHASDSEVTQDTRWFPDLALSSSSLVSFAHHCLLLLSFPYSLSSQGPDK